MNKVSFLEDDPILGEGLITDLEIERFATFWAHFLVAGLRHAFFTPYPPAVKV